MTLVYTQQAGVTGWGVCVLLGGGGVLLRSRSVAMATGGLEGGQGSGDTQFP